MRVSVEGADLYMSMRGEGPVCLVLTAIGTKPYERQIPARLSDSLKLAFVDLRGSGQSTGDPTDLTFDTLADDLEAVRLHLGMQRVAVLGHSILGALAIEYGKRRPASASHVIAVGTPPRGDMAWLSAQATSFFDKDASEERKRALRENLAALPQDATSTQRVCAQTPMRFFDARFDAAPLFAEAEDRPALLRHIIGTLMPNWNVTASTESLRTPDPPGARTLRLHGALSPLGRRFVEPTQRNDAHLRPQWASTVFRGAGSICRRRERVDGRTPLRATMMPPA
jgi:proline iminopeptidase